MVSSFGFALLWLGFSLYAFTLAPAADPNTLDLIIQLSSGQWSGLNPLVVTLFNLMGIWPMAYACLALIDGCGQKVPAWPFVAGSFGFGAFALLPYLALRSRNTTFSPPKTALLKGLDSPWTGRLLLAGALALIGYGLADGNWAANWADFLQQWQTSQFIHVMSLDFCLLCVIFAPLLKDDIAKRDFPDSRFSQNSALSSGLFWLAVLVPLVGILIYLSVRPPLPESDASDATAVTA